MVAAAASATRAITWRAATRPGASVEWGTPQAIYLALDTEFRFTLDAAASAENVQHVRYVEKETDALRIPWLGERVFCNPPYGTAIGSWVRKAALEAVENGALVVMLLPARTDVRWFHESVLGRAEVRFIRGRLGYVRRAGTRGRAPFASMVVVFRPGGVVPPGSREQLLFPFLHRNVTG